MTHPNPYIASVGYNGEENWNIQNLDDSLFSPLKQGLSEESEPQTNHASSMQHLMPKLPPKRKWNCLANHKKIATERTTRILSAAQVVLLHIAKQYQNKHSSEMTQNDGQQLQNATALWLNFEQFKTFIQNDVLLDTTYHSQAKNLSALASQYFESIPDVTTRQYTRNLFLGVSKELNDLHHLLT
ncbi:MAG: hypothetical protein KDK63_03260 [Chlamydiia bacterium]|nr:hypothetical protein [Chlamydiia bacterium]MCB1114963.1 hypothetical protein [Chlamydiia bacterium]